MTKTETNLLAGVCGHLHTGARDRGEWSTNGEHYVIGWAISPLWTSASELSIVEVGERADANLWSENDWPTGMRAGAISERIGYTR